MRAYLAILLLLTPIHTFACPNIAGRYQCKIARDTYDLDISQEAANNYSVISLNYEGQKNSNLYIIDSKSRKLSDNEVSSIDYIANCNADRIKIHLFGDLYEYNYDETEKEIIGFDSKLNFIKTKNSQNLKIVTTVEFTRQLGDVVTKAPSTENCTRL